MEKLIQGIEGVTIRSEDGDTSGGSQVSSERGSDGEQELTLEPKVLRNEEEGLKQNNSRVPVVGSSQGNVQQSKGYNCVETSRTASTASEGTTDTEFETARDDEKVDGIQTSISNVPETSAKGHSKDAESDCDSDFVQAELDWSSDEFEPIEDPVNLWDRGVTIELLQELLLDHELEHMTSRQVVSQFVLPQTADYECSLAGLMKRSFPHTVKKATHYVIHPWDANFGRLIQMLISVDAAYRTTHGGEEAVFWIDMMAVDQHLHCEGYTDEEKIWLHRDKLLQSVRSCIEATPYTCLFMEPIHNPIVLSRSWCLFEMVYSLFFRRELILAPCPEPPGTQPLKPVLENVAAAVQRFTPDFENTKTSSDRDHEWLMTAVTAAHSSGIAWLNDQVGKVMLHWLAQEVLNEIYRLDQPVPVSSLRDLASLLESLSNIDQAHMQYTLALNTARDQLGLDHTLTLAITHDLACLKAKHMFKFDEAEDLLREALRGRESIYGPSQDVTNDTVLALARLLQAQSRLDEAEVLYRRALKYSLELHGFEHRGTLVAANLLALLLQNKGEFREAYVLLTRTLKVGMSSLGSKHLDVLVWCNNMAVLLQDARDLQHAESLFRKTLADCEAALGKDHSQTLNVVFNLGQCLWQQGKKRAAEMLFRRELASCQALYGIRHRDTVRSFRNIIDFLVAEDREDEAEEYIEILQQTGETYTRGKQQLSDSESEESRGESQSGSESQSESQSQYDDESDFDCTSENEKELQIGEHIEGEDDTSKHRFENDNCREDESSCIEENLQEKVKTEADTIGSED
mmetsp:Transcript_16743/g.30746  ORF Transcript_16743/g.30746 Transcript_16743/m.30746 type:complete len:801 (+) Transcript_16743:291-2693(+)